MPALPENLIGMNLGPYRILDQIGRGGMAMVFKAYEAALDRYVAIKVLPQYDFQDTTFEARFEREAKAIARLNHPNILPVYHYGKEGSIAYIVMQYVSGGTLKDRLGKPLPLDVVAHYFRQIGSAMDYAHQHNILHRDIKPNNVLIGEDNWVLLADFGLAKMMESDAHLTMTGVGMGTPAYMSPEQGQGLKVDLRSDIYSLGIVLYEMVTGRVPFEAETPMAVVLKHITAPLPLPCMINSALDEGVQNVILKALAKEPDHRYQTAGEMVSALNAAIAKAEERTQKLSVQKEPPAVPTIVEKAVLPDPTEVEDIKPAAQTAPLAARIPELGIAEEKRSLSDSGAIAPSFPHASLSRSTKPLAETLDFAPKKGLPRRYLIAAGIGLVVMVVLVAALLNRNQIAALLTPPTQVAAVTQLASPTVRPQPGSTKPPTAEKQPGLTVDTIPIVFEVEIFSSSDWARVFVHSPVRSTLKGKIIGKNGMMLGAELDSYNQLMMNQELGRAFAGHRISVRMAFEVVNISPDDSIDLNIGKGCVGDVFIFVFNMNTGKPVPVHYYAETDCEVHNVTFPATALMTGKPERFPEPEGGFMGPAFPEQADLPTSKILYQCFDIQPPQICVRNVKTGQTEQITKDLKFNGITTMSWSPNGKQIVLGAEYEGRMRIYRMNADGTNLTEVPINLENPQSPAWSPDGEKILFWAGKDEKSVIGLVRPDGGELKTLFLKPSFVPSALAWSPDGRRIAFLDLFDWDRRPVDVWIMNAEGSDAHILYSFPEQRYATFLAWQPDGGQLLVWNSDQRGWVLITMDGKARPVNWSTPGWWLPSFWPWWGDYLR